MVLAVIALAGCATTQQEAARLQLNSARLRASEHAVRISKRDLDVRVEQVAVVRGAGGSAIIVRLRNLSAQPLSDLPISVGVVARSHRRLYLNGDAGLDYFSTHTPSIAAGGELTWVLRTDRRLPAGGRGFAEVGPPAALPLAAPGVTLPAISVGLGSAATRGAIQITVRNRSNVPQYQLPVYAVAVSHGRYRAAGEVTIPHLGTGSGTTFELGLIGDPGGAAIALEAPATIFG